MAERLVPNTLVGTKKNKLASPERSVGIVGGAVVM